MYSCLAMLKVLTFKGELTMSISTIKHAEGCLKTAWDALGKDLSSIQNPDVHAAYLLTKAALNALKLELANRGLTEEQL